MNPKLKEKLIDLAHHLHQAIVTDDDRVAESALSDLRASLGAEKVKVEGEGEQGGDHRAARTGCEPYRDGETRNDYSRFLTVAQGVTLVRFAGRDEVTLMAKRPANNSGLPPAIFKVFVDKVRKLGCVCCDDKTLFEIVGRECQSSCQLERVCVGALRRILRDRRARTLRAYRQRKSKKNSATQVNG